MRLTPSVGHAVGGFRAHARGSHVMSRGRVIALDNAFRADRVVELRAPLRRMRAHRHVVGVLVDVHMRDRKAMGVTHLWIERDAHGLPVAHVHVDEHPNDVAMRAHATEWGAKLYDAIGAKRTIKGNHPPATHNMGTARMSAKPSDGVTNAWGQTHDIKNLFVSDGSLLSTPGSANPTLTIVALALRQSKYIRREMGAEKYMRAWEAQRAVPEQVFPRSRGANAQRRRLSEERSRSRANPQSGRRSDADRSACPQ